MRRWFDAVFDSRRRADANQTMMSVGIILGRNKNRTSKAQGPQGRAVADPPMIYSIVQCMPIEAHGRLRYRIKSKSENVERVVTEDQLSYAQ